MTDEERREHLAAWRRRLYGGTGLRVSDELIEALLRDATTRPYTGGQRESEEDDDDA